MNTFLTGVFPPLKTDTRKLSKKFIYLKKKSLKNSITTAYFVKNYYCIN